MSDQGAAFESLLDGLVAGPGGVRNPLVRIETGDGRLLWEGARGAARADAPQPLTPAHRIHIASIAKTMTAALVLRLAERGAFGPRGIDARYADFDVLESRDIDRLSCRGGESFGRTMTLRHLLTHTAGLRDAMVDDATALGGPAPGSLIGRMTSPSGDPRRSWVAWDPARPGDPGAGVVNFFLNSGISGAALGCPGAAFHYSDTGFMLLGLLLERVADRPYHAQLHEQLFAPLDLSDTYLAYHDDPPDVGGKREPEADCWAVDVPCLSSGFNLSFDWAGGGVVSSARSLNAFLRALLRGQLFMRPGTLDEMLDWRVPPGLQEPRTGTGLGIFRTGSPCGDLVGHSGAWGAKMVYCRDLDLFFAGTTNQSACDPNWHWPFLQAAGAARGR